MELSHSLFAGVETDYRRSRFIAENHRHAVARSMAARRRRRERHLTSTSRRLRAA